MTQAVIFRWAEARGAPTWLSALLARLPGDWRLTHLAPCVAMAARPGTVSSCRRLGSHLVVGEIRSSPGYRLDAEAHGDAGSLDLARRLTREAWGGYVLVSWPDTGGLTLYRDPSGEVDAFCWNRDGVSVAATVLPIWLDRALPFDARISEVGVAGLLVDPTRQSAHLALDGVRGLAPGEYVAPGGSEQVWRPAAWAGKAVRGRSDPEELVEVVDLAVNAMAGERTLIEVSGGLDSAIVATSLTASGRGVACALNYHVRDPQGDERPYARLVAAACGVQLTEVEKETVGFDAGDLPRGLARPGLNAFDVQHDADVARRCLEGGCDTLITGQGGDDVFFQAPTPKVVADGLRYGIAAAEVLSLARRQGWSVYRFVREGLFSGERPRPRAPFVTERAVRLAELCAPHPWLVDLQDTSPAKRLQIAGLANALIVKGDAHRARASRLRHPLLSQPVVEYCLSLSVPDLVRGTDRGLAREAFAGRLPAPIVQRKGKGRMSSHYVRGLALSLPPIRSLLLDGRLAAHGLIDRASLDGLLTVEHLMWRGGIGPMANALMLELWLREWEGRLIAKSRFQG